MSTIVRSMRRGLPAATLVLLCLTLVSITGCGYTTAELYPQQYQSVSVPIFTNRTFYKGIEFDLGEALTKQIESRTPYKLAPASQADTALTGTITDVSQRQITRTEEANLPEIMEVSVTVDYEWKDLRTGKTILDRTGFTDVGQYVPARPVSQPFKTGQHGAVGRLAQDIVGTMRSDW